LSAGKCHTRWHSDQRQFQQTITHGYHQDAKGTAGKAQISRYIVEQGSQLTQNGHIPLIQVKCSTKNGHIAYNQIPLSEKYALQIFSFDQIFCSDTWDPFLVSIF
jgi:hypothetical protein